MMTASSAVGSRQSMEETRKKLGLKTLGRRLVGSGGQWVL